MSIDPVLPDPNTSQAESPTALAASPFPSPFSCPARPYLGRQARVTAKKRSSRSNKAMGCPAGLCGGRAMNDGEADAGAKAPTLRALVVKATVTHTITYFGFGLLALFVLDYRASMPRRSSCT